MKILNKVLVLSALFGSLGFEGVNCADFSTSLKALSKRVAAVNNFNESMVKPGMSFIEKKKIELEFVIYIWRSLFCVIYSKNIIRQLKMRQLQKNI